MGDKPRNIRTWKHVDPQAFSLVGKKIAGYEATSQSCTVYFVSGDALRITHDELAGAFDLDYELGTWR